MKNRITFIILIIMIFSVIAEAGTGSDIPELVVRKYCELDYDGYRLSRDDGCSITRTSAADPFVGCEEQR